MGADETLWLCNVCKEPGCVGAMGELAPEGAQHEGGEP